MWYMVFACWSESLRCTSTTEGQVHMHACHCETAIKFLIEFSESSYTSVGCMFIKGGVAICKCGVYV